MGYFRELPNLEYESPFATRISSSSYVQAKNIFRRMKIRDDLQNVFTLFNKYEIREGARPDTIAEDLYGKSDLDGLSYSLPTSPMSEISGHCLVKTYTNTP